jgi:hypothetical protein
MTEPTIPSIARLGALIEEADSLLICTLEELLQGVPLHAPRKIHTHYGGSTARIEFPPVIRVHCEGAQCDGVRRHQSVGQDSLFVDDDQYYFFVDYKCTDCQSLHKVFAVKAQWEEKTGTAWIYTKIYEEPPFGSPIPKRLSEVIGEENRNHFLKARRAIARGLGIGAYAYYRRIVENTKFDLVDSVLKVAEATNASSTQIDLLTQAQSERQFSKAVEMLREVSAIPAVLLIDGHNPLLLLHDLLSDGVHQFSDSECLERARDAEVILCEISNRMQMAVTERKEVKSALASILNRKGGQ